MAGTEVHTEVRAEVRAGIQAGIHAGSGETAANAAGSSAAGNGTGGNIAGGNSTRGRGLRNHPVYRPLAVLACAAGFVLVASTVVGGWAVGGLAALVLTAAGALIARYAVGGWALDDDARLSVRLVEEQEPSLLNWTTRVEIGRTNVPDFERVLRPRLERLYAAHLAERHGVSLYNQPEQAAKLVGPLWWWIDPGRPVPEPVRGKSAQLPTGLIAALVQRLEEL